LEEGICFWDVNDGIAITDVADNNVDTVEDAVIRIL
jgi:hypothetical protein